MKHALGILGFLTGGLIHLAAGPATAQAEKDDVRIVISPLGATSCHTHRGRFQAFEKRIHMMRGHMRGQALSLTGCEMWSMPREGLEAFRKASAGSGVVVTELGADWNDAFRSAPSSMRLNPKQREVIELAKAARATTGVKIMMGPPPAVLEYVLTKDANDPASKEAAKITVALSDRTVRTIVRTSIDIRTDMVVWRGMTEESGGTVTLVWWPSGKMAGTIQSVGRVYSIRHLGASIYAVVEMSEERMPEEHAPMSERLRALDPNLRDDPLIKQGDASLLRTAAAAYGRGARRSTSAVEKPQQQGGDVGGTSAPVKEIVIDVIVAYTRKAARHYEDIRRELLDLSIEEANHAFRISNLGHIRLRLVHAYETDYVEQGEHFDHLYRMVDKGDGYMEEIHSLRDRYRADIGVLVVDDAQGCGLATRVYAEADEAFAVVHHACSAATYSMAHEIGHLIGARHEPSIDSNMQPFSYGHGYVNGTNWRDIMSQKISCGGCPRLPVWSSPKVLISGQPAGTPEIDNARVIAEQAARVAAFR